jgi:GTP cyclohydrolase II
MFTMHRMASNIRFHHVLYSAFRAYNLIDQGYDTMEANVQLGHPADGREYQIASAILRDLGITSVRLLTNNPEKLESMKRDGVVVSERVPMIPASWSAIQSPSTSSDDLLTDVHVANGVDGTETVTTTVTTTTIRKKGTSQPKGFDDRDEYLVTKIQRMGHILDIPEPLLKAVNDQKKSKDDLFDTK